MEKPTLHLNGTGRRDLFAAYDAATDAVRAALAAVAQTAPNGRDYYVQAPGAFTVAQDEHFIRLTRLREVLAELEALAEHVVSAPGPGRL